jgi:hypothetical protein
MTVKEQSDIVKMYFLFMAISNGERSFKDTRKEILLTEKSENWEYEEGLIADIYRLWNRPTSRGGLL